MWKWLRSQTTIVLIIGLALILRLPLLNGSFWLDEAAQALESSRPLNQQLDITDDFQPPLLHLITHFALQFSSQEWWLRFCGALIPSLLTIWGTYLLGKKLHHQKVGLLSALFLGTSSFFIFFSQELRPYALSTIFTIWSWFFLLEAQNIGQDSYQLKRKSWLNKFFQLFPLSHDLFLFLFFTILGLYSSYLYPFVLASQILFLLYKKDWFTTIYAAVIPTIAFLPWLPEFLAQLQAGQTLRANFPGWENIVSFSFLQAPALTFGKFIFGVLNLEINFSYLLITGLFCFLVLTLIFSQTKKFWQQNKPKFVLYFFFLIVPFVLASLVSLFIPVIQPKRVIFLLPFLYLFLSFLIFEQTDDWHKLGKKNWTLLILILAINMFSTFTYYRDANLQRENWRHALDTLHQNYDEEKTIALFAYAAPFSPWTWYENTHNQPFATLATGNYNTNTLTDLNNSLSPTLNYQEVIVFDYLRSLTDSQNLLPKYLLNHGYYESQILDYPNLGFIRIYSHKLASSSTEIQP